MKQPFDEKDILFDFEPNEEECNLCPTWDIERYVVYTPKDGKNATAILLGSGRWVSAGIYDSPLVARLLKERDDLIAKEAALRAKVIQSHEEICQTFGKALGYPWFRDSQDCFPGATEEEGVCVGEQVAETLAIQAAERMRGLTAERDDLQHKNDIYRVALEALQSSARKQLTLDHPEWDCIEALDLTTAVLEQEK